MIAFAEPVEVEAPLYDELHVATFLGLQAEAYSYHRNWLVERWDDYGRPYLADPVDNRTYAEKRRMEYPPIEDYLDGVVKNDQAQIDAYVAACLAVKEKYPKE